MIMTQKEAAHRLRMATIGKTGYENTLVSVDALRIVLDGLEGFRQARNIATPECKHCNDTGSLSKSLEGQFDCHHCGRADENVRVLKWYADTHLDSGSEADVLNVYYHGLAAGADLQRARIAELEREVAANRQQITQLDRELSAERMVHGATKRLKEQMDAQLKAAPAPQWIACSDRLPEVASASYQVAAICTKKYPDDSNYPGQGVRGVYQDWVIRSWPQNYTHWMPLPAAPSPADNGGGNATE